MHSLSVAIVSSTSSEHERKNRLASVAKLRSICILTGTRSAPVQTWGVRHHHLAIASPRADVVAASHGVYHNALEPISDLETHIGDAIIGYITDLPSICKPNPPREVLAITPIDLMVKIIEFRKLLPHLPPIYLINVIWARRAPG